MNLATHLLVDAYEGDFEAAVVVSNDSEPLLILSLTKDAHPCASPYIAAGSTIRSG